MAPIESENDYRAMAIAMTKIARVAAVTKTTIIRMKTKGQTAISNRLQLLSPTVEFSTFCCTWRSASFSEKGFVNGVP